MDHRQQKMPVTQGVTLPSLDQKKSSIAPNAPTGGFWRLSKLALNEPTRAFNKNLFEASNRASRTIPQDGMTADVYSAYWSGV